MPERPAVGAQQSLLGLQPERMSGDDQVSGGGDGQEFSHSFHQAEDDRIFGAQLRHRFCGGGGSVREGGLAKDERGKNQKKKKLSHGGLVSAFAQACKFICGRPPDPKAGPLMSALPVLTAQLLSRRDLAAADATEAARELADPAIGDDAKAAFLCALADKGETSAEVAALAQAFRAMAVNPGVEAWAPSAIDIVGTGGDHAGGFNISSLVVLTLASLGVTVMKHGNRGVTSLCGSADLLAALGVDLQAPSEKLRRALVELDYVFFFAPAYHPAFKSIGPVRKSLATQGRRTVFNILGPLINPGRPAHVLLGVFAESAVPTLAGAFQALGTHAGVAVHGILGPGRGIDELTTATVNRVRGFGRLSALDATWHAADFGFETSPFEHLKGGDLTVNLAIVEAILSGRAPRGLTDTIALNAAVALWICGRTAQIAEGIAPAREALVGGAVKNKIAATREFYRS